MRKEDTLPEDITEEQAKLREQLRLLSTKTNDLIYEQRKQIFGRVSTIVEAAVSDAEQRKAIKDLLSNAIYTDSYWNSIAYEFRQLAEANGFVLWEEFAPTNVPVGAIQASQPMNEYEKV